MRKPRDHAAAYQKRKASALARGFTVAQARGHPGKGQPYIRGPPPSAEETRRRLEDAVKSYRKLGRQDLAAKSAQVSQRRFRSFLRENDLLVRDGRRWVLADHRPRTVLTYSRGRRLKLTVPDYENAALAGAYWAAAGRALRDNEPMELLAFQDRGVTDIAGRFHPFETDLRKIYGPAHTGGESFEQVYRFTT